MTDRLAAFVWSRLVGTLRIGRVYYRGESLLVVLNACDKARVPGVPIRNMARDYRMRQFAHTLRELGFMVTVDARGRHAVVVPRS